LKVEKERISKDFSKTFGAEIIGSSDKIIEIKRQLSVISPQDISVLITGETGTGKELAARTIHNASSRKNRPFIALNCAALPETLLESELFGHEKGAFTGADSRRAGRFEQAEGGTIFLDEIAEMSVGLQAKLLRVLETRKITRLGGSGEIDIDVRIIAATNIAPEKAIEKKGFRPDLYYRIAAFRLHMPPLRERKSDIPELAAHFVVLANDKFDRDVTEIDRTALNQLTVYPWFGNIRELASAVEEAVLFAPGKRLRIDDFPSKIRKVSMQEIHDENLPECWEAFLQYKGELISNIEERVLRQLMAQYNWNVSKAARAFKINRSQLHQLLNKYGIVTKD
ncbi:MAG: sigma-54 interaction domain-containing protein, partial [bacterium]